MEHIFQEKLKDNARALIARGIAQKAIRQAGIRGDAFPVIILSTHENSNHYYLGIENNQERTKIIPVGQLNPDEETLIYPPFFSEDLDYISKLANSTLELIEKNELSNNLDIGGLSL